MKYAFAFLAMLPSAVQADLQYWDYKDWRVVVDRFDTGEDWRVNCTALTGGDGMPTLRISVSNGDALPPDVYPVPVLNEFAPHGYNTMMHDGDRVMFVFDSGNRTEGFVTGGYDDDGILEAFARPVDADALWMLQTMQRSDRLWITLDGETVYEASLAGFTAAYGKIAEQCAFPTTGVIK